MVERSGLEGGASPGSTGMEELWLRYHCHMLFVACERRKEMVADVRRRRRWIHSKRKDTSKLRKKKANKGYIANNFLTESEVELKETMRVVRVTLLQCQLDSTSDACPQ